MKNVFVIYLHIVNSLYLNLFLRGFNSFSVVNLISFDLRRDVKEAPNSRGFVIFKLFLRHQGNIILILIFLWQC